VRFPKFANSLVAVLALAAVAPVVGGCAASTEEPPAEPVGTTAAAASIGEVIPIASGVFGLVNGGFTAFTVLDSFVRYGAPTPTAEVLDQLKTANKALADLQVSQNQQFLQLNVNLVIGELTISSRRSTAPGASSRPHGRTGPPPRSCSTLTWDDLDQLSNKLASANGTFAVMRRSSGARTVTRRESKDPTASGTRGLPLAAPPPRRIPRRERISFAELAPATSDEHRGQSRRSVVISGRRARCRHDHDLARARGPVAEVAVI
jgi:hypothetical protein